MSVIEMMNERVGTLVANQPRLAPVFEKHQIDYCCRGKTSLADACLERKLDLQVVLGDLEQVMRSVPSEDDNWSDLSLCDLVDHIVETHHGFLRELLPRISGLVEKVRNAHGKRHPELLEVHRVFEEMRAELESHMLKEETILFPWIQKLESADGSPEFMFGSVANPISAMEHEHDDAGNALRRLRELTGGFKPPAGACPTYCVMMDSLSILEADLHLHIHKENNILFPRAIRLEKQSSLT